MCVDFGVDVEQVIHYIYSVCGPAVHLSQGCMNASRKIMLELRWYWPRTHACLPQIWDTFRKIIRFLLNVLLQENTCINLTTALHRSFSEYNVTAVTTDKWQVIMRSVECGPMYYFGNDCCMGHDYPDIL